MSYKRYILKDRPLPRGLIVFEMPAHLKGKRDSVLAIPYGKGGIAGQKPFLMSRKDLATDYDRLADDAASLASLIDRQTMGIPAKVPTRGRGKKRRPAGAILLTDAQVEGGKPGPKGNARPDMTGGGKLKQPIHVRKARPRLQSVPQYTTALPVSDLESLTQASARWLGGVVHRPNSPVRELILTVDAPYTQNKHSIAQNMLARLCKGKLVERRARLVPDARGHMSEILHYAPTHKGNSVWSQWVDRQREVRIAAPGNGAEAQPTA